MEVNVWPGATGTLPCAHWRWVTVRTLTPSILTVCSYWLDVVIRYGGIRCLNLVAIHELQSSQICALLPRLTTLTALDLSHNPLMDNEVGQSISANCAFQFATSTATFTCTFMRPQFVDAGDAGTSLTALRISSCKKISDAGSLFCFHFFYRHYCLFSMFLSHYCLFSLFLSSLLLHLQRFSY
jgi:hypothetical protein